MSTTKTQTHADRLRCPIARTTAPALMVVGVSFLLSVQGADTQAELQQHLSSQFTLTTVTPDRNDIAAAGTQVELRKNGFMAYSVDSPVPYLNNYDKKGHISQPFMSNLGAGVLAQGKKNYPTRIFRAGEKLWIVGLFVRNDGVTFRLYSDPYGAIRYYGDLKFPFEKGSTPTADEVLTRISEALTAQAVENVGAPAASGQPQPIEPARIEVGQTIEQVVTVLGQPEKTAKAGNKEIYFYKDLKVTFVDGKVSDVQ
jgi:hypothetical protein